MNYVLKVNGATIKYRSNYNSKKTIQAANTAVNNVSFAIETGDYCCIVGMNGSGKSSLIKSILGLIPLFSGSIEYGIEREKISYMPQINSILPDFPATVKEIVLTGAQKNRGRLPFYSFYSKEDTASADNAMEILNIKGIAKKKFGELSGGQQQKVLLARALCKNPLLLILDEPCAGLDQGAIDGFYKLLYNLNSANRVTILMISHDLHDVQKYAKHIIEMNANLLFYGTPQEWTEWKRKRNGQKM